jgi:Protein of unknown function (DUF4019)
LEGFLRAIPAAATSELALVAYAICGVLFLLAGAKLRAIRAVLRSLADVPAADRRHVIEAVTGSVIPARISADDWIRHNRNKWLFLLCASALILVATIVAIAFLGPRGDVGPGPPPPADVAIAESDQWLKGIDAGDYKGSYDVMLKGFRERHSLQQWLSTLERYHRPLGRVESRQVAGTQSGTVRQGVPLNVHTIMYFTKFEHMKAPIREVVGLASPGLPEPWRVSSYNVDVPPSSPDLAASAPK